MAAKKNRIKALSAEDVLSQALISVRSIADFFTSASHNKRSVKPTKRAYKELTKGRKPKEVATELGISYQRLTALGKKVKQGKAYSPELRRLFEGTRRDLEKTRPLPSKQKPRKPPESIKQVLDQGLTQRDKRTQSSTRRALRDLEQSGRKPGEIAKSLGLSVQRYNSLKKKIESGAAYSPELRDMLKRAQVDYVLTPQRLKHEGGKVWYFPDMDRLKKKQKHVDTIKSFVDLQDALQWWRKVANSGKYLAITQKDGVYYVVGLGNRSQRPRGGKKDFDSTGENRVTDLISTYIEREEEEEEEYDEEEEEEYDEE